MTTDNLTHSQHVALNVLRNAHHDKPGDKYPLHGPTGEAHVSSLRALCRRGLAKCSLGVYFRAVEI